MAANSGTTIANNTPVGSAGQPIKKEISESRASAIRRRLKKKVKDDGKRMGMSDDE